jgi:hypothetical protein
MMMLCAPMSIMPADLRGGESLPHGEGEQFNAESNYLDEAFDSKCSTRQHAESDGLIVFWIANRERADGSGVRAGIDIGCDHPRLSIRRQCELVSISRASFYRHPVGESPENLELMRIIDEAFMEMPWYGSRQMARHLRRQGWCVGRKRVRRLMRKIGLSPIYQAPKTSEPHPQHRIYPYLLRHLAIERPDQVWCADVTYIPMRRGFLYLVAVMDWFSRKVLTWRLSNTMDAVTSVNVV